jgi:hypothetical protein
LFVAPRDRASLRGNCRLSHVIKPQPKPTQLLHTSPPFTPETRGAVGEGAICAETQPHCRSHHGIWQETVAAARAGPEQTSGRFAGGAAASRDQGRTRVEASTAARVQVAEGQDPRSRQQRDPSTAAHSGVGWTRVLLHGLAEHGHGVAEGAWEHETGCWA